ncbi:XRE family transcriptional regulator [Verrucosispora sp. WMMD1129]|uniref:helix-turn-helix domain-containing protein n=1 Tax=Verrucosispora sp. WMMD1129 TaxID=3016093 RepID=UPI00249C8A2E|nr:XRE family transcriptional regulator [Verrucosispora sp. WMMD1129]WFE44759.1 XRE family transcriptional regulator [Verrucosispora sp. WMMD1129]
MTPANCPRCGARLARDNDSGRCAPCQAAERDRLSAPPEVPASFWSHPPLRAALMERHLGRVIRAYRHHPYHGRAALPQAVVASWLGITQAQLSRVENGPPLVHLDRLAHWAALLRIPAEHLWFDVVGGEHHPVSKLEPRTAIAAKGPDESRRILLAGIAAVAAGAGFLCGSTGLQSRRIGAADVARLNAVLELYWSVDAECGGGALYEEVARFAESVYRMLDWSHPASLSPQLVASVAAARQLAGWTALDTGRYSEAQRHFVAGERAALAADDRPLTAMIRYSQAKQLQHLRHNLDALAALQLARGQLGSQATPAVNSLLLGAEAASLAALGDHRAAERALAESSSQFERICPEREPSWMAFYDRGELLAQYGRVYRDKARQDKKHGSAAVRFVTDAIDAFGPGNVRSSLLNEVGLCSALFLADEPEQALTVGRRVLFNAESVSSARVIDRVNNLRRDLTRHHGLPDVAAFAQDLATLKVRR